jgi:hypothetical protein
MEDELRELLLSGTLSLTSFDGHCVRIDFESREEAEDMFDFLDELAGGTNG